jgi:hypothetical protein
MPPVAVAQPVSCAQRELASLDVTKSSDGWVLIPIQVGPAKLQSAIDLRPDIQF